MLQTVFKMFFQTVFGLFVKQFSNGFSNCFQTVVGCLFDARWNSAAGFALRCPLDTLGMFDGCSLEFRNSVCFSGLDWRCYVSMRVYFRREMPRALNTNTNECR